MRPFAWLYTADPGRAATRLPDRLPGAETRDTVEPGGDVRASRSAGAGGRWLDAVASGLRLLGGLPRFLRHATTTEFATVELRSRLAARGETLIAAIRRASRAPATPYPSLFQAAGITPTAAERLVQRSGVEPALAELLEGGVFLSVEELTGRAPVMRRGYVLEGAARVSARGRQFGPWTSSSGSRGRARIVPVDFEFLAERASDDRLFLEARGALQWEHAVWEAPGGGLLTLLRYARCGIALRRWFSPIDPRTPGLGPRYRWSAAFAQAGQPVGRRASASPGGRADRAPRSRARLDAGGAASRWHASSRHVRDPGPAARARGARERSRPVGSQAHRGWRAAHPGAAPDHREHGRSGRPDLPDGRGRGHRLRVSVSGR